MMNIHGTHYPILAAAVARTKGSVLELGTGEFSTVMLHYACMGRTLISVDTDGAWLDRYAPHYSAPGAHEFVHVKTKADDVTSRIQAWRDWPGIETQQWGVIFVDNAPGEARHELMIRGANRAHFVVAHDSEVDYKSGGNYSYAVAAKHFKYVTEFRRWRPYSIIMSNVEAFGIEECDKVWSPPK